MQNQLKQKEIAKFLNVSPAKIKKFTEDGMPHILVGKTPRYDCSEVLVWFKETTQDIYKGHFILGLHKLLVGSCGCTTKTPDMKYHKEWCMARRIQELIDSL